MIRRLLATAGVAASLFSATVAAAPDAVAAPGDPDQVALLVQKTDGTDPIVECVDYRSGMTGADVLVNAGLDPKYGTGPYAGFVLQIAGFGNNRDKPPTNSTYWAYWRGTQAGSYSYSGSGVTSTQPAAGSVEAWVWYENGEVSFPKRSYASLCPGGFDTTPAPATTPASTPTRVAAPSGSGGGAGGGSTAPGATTAPGASDSTTTPGSPGSPSTPGGATAPGATPSTAPSGSTSAGGSASPDTSTSVAASAVAVTEDAGGLGTGPTIGLLAVGAAVVAFGALAVVARRRRAEED